jgi:2'-5' RNA ligase
MRLFLGIPLADVVVDELLKLSTQLRRKDDGLRWSAPESWHVTLQFLGNTEQEQYDRLVARLRELRLPAALTCLEGTGFFERAGIFYAGVKPMPELLTLQQRVTAVTSLCGFAPEDRPYRPHITLARGKGREGERALRYLKKRVERQPRFTGFSAEEFLLYESFTGAERARYEVRERFPLMGR